VAVSVGVFSHTLTFLCLKWLVLNWAQMTISLNRSARAILCQGVKTILRRSRQTALPEEELIIGRLRLISNRYDVFLGEEKLELTPKEYELLKLLVTNTSKVFTRKQLLKKYGIMNISAIHALLMFIFDFYGENSGQRRR